MLRVGAILFTLASAALTFGFKGTAVAAASLADVLFFLFIGLVVLGLIVGSKLLYKKNRVKLFKRLVKKDEFKLGHDSTITKYAIGQVVYDKVRPGQTLIVKRIASSLYYCQPKESYTNRVLAYLERDLMSAEF
jgi:uncharacterized membrane protein YtjA (UPF0391 family)